MVGGVYVVVVVVDVSGEQVWSAGLHGVVVDAVPGVVVTGSQMASSQQVPTVTPTLT